MTQCAHCHIMNDDGEKFCTQCGAPLVPLTHEPGTALFIKDLEGFTGYASLFHFNPPIKGYPDLDDNGDELPAPAYEYAVVSATYAMFSGPETFIFPADSEGKVIDWGELPSSFKGSTDIAHALENAGYERVT